MFRTIALGKGLVRRPLRCAVFQNTTKSICLQTTRRRFKCSCLATQQPKVYPAVGFNALRGYCSGLPKHTKVTLPALSPTMEEGTLISWAKKEGDKLNEGDLLAEIETDKATMAFETPEEGYLAKILIAAGTKGIPIGKLVCIIVEEAADVAAFKDFKDDGAAVAKPKAAPAAKAPPAAAPAPAAAAPPPPAAPAAAGAPGTRVYASPMAKKLAEQKNIRLQGKGTGLFDSITSSDLAKMGAGAPATAHAPGGAKHAAPPTMPSGSTYIDIPVSNMRAVIAKRLLESKQTIPHYYLQCNLNADKLLAVREKFNKMLEKQKIRISVNDFIVKASAMASHAVPEGNTSWRGDVMRQYKNVDVSVAVATDKGLMTPIIFEAQTKGVTEISKEVKKLAAKAREGKLQPQEFQGGTITISNLGMFGVDNFCAIVNPPQSVIVAVGRLTPHLVKCSKSEQGFKESQFLTVVISCDHRVMDGAVGAKWLQKFRSYIEDPETMIL